ncbi:energy-coupling factor transport system substrate-specific component [Kineothrix alysoides]|uniref:Energy-coupling factor transport system substrate-specific component n=1 Tax=Kineothrix alysoides TaxID=1469948 RepID=A0A4R1QNN5_9FIRM|nr:MptD family putative ECF transporter S component [Kineothrix alysoides]TCL55379.1 energy-coupling factor transport system substrate-specific component [Kineothrix alysoides]
MSEKTKLKSKDLIVAGAFAALYVVVLFITVGLTGFIPVLYLMAPLILGVVLGSIYMLYVTKVPKRGAIFILAVAVGLVTSMGGVWLAGVWSLLCGLIAELIAYAGKYRSRKLYIISYMVFACTGMGPFWLLVFAKEAFLQACLNYYNQDYVNKLDALTPSWFIFVLLGLALIGGLIGGLLGNKLLKKHFEKAGVV